MKTNNSPGTTRLSRQALELSIAAPQVVAQRVTRMVMAGPNPSARDQKEFKQMSDEKIAAFYQSWLAIWGQMFRSQLAFSQAFVLAATSAVLAGKQPSSAATLSMLNREVSKVWSAGIEPVHSKAVSNAKRLSRGV
jgi:hypothetical protein